MGHLRRISGNTWGAPLVSMRQLYVSKARAIISYASGAWFIRDGDGAKLVGGISGDVVAQLTSLQYQSPGTSLGGRSGGTPRELVERELGVESIEVFLCRASQASRARTHGGRESRKMAGLRDLYPTAPRGLPQHPYRHFDELAGRQISEARARLHEKLPDEDIEVLWANPKTRHKAINKYIEEEALERCRQRWAMHQREWHNKPNLWKYGGIPVSVEGPWNPKSFKLYRNLSRPQSSILLQCRTGVIGLAAYLNSRKVCCELSLFLSSPTSPSVG